MAYNVYAEPKIDWDSSKGVTDEDFNRIEGNALALLNNHKSNDLINGCFDIWQRGISQSISTGGVTKMFFLADRWYRYLNGTDTVGVDSQIGFTAGQTNVPNNPMYAYRSKVTSQTGGMTNNELMQSIEDVRKYSGKQVTISFYAAATAAKTINIILSQNFGTGGSAEVLTEAVPVAIGTAWAKYTVTVTMPSISGKTIGAANTHYTGLFIKYPLNETYQIDIAEVKLENGPIATPCIPKSYMEELRDCLRFFEALSAVNCVFGIGFNTSIYGGIAKIKFEPKRVVPTVVTTGATFECIDENEAGVAINAVSVNNKGTTSALVHFTSAASDLIVGGGNMLLGTAGFIAIDAELV
jgi:hypothetical protein